MINNSTIKNIKCHAEECMGPIFINECAGNIDGITCDGNKGVNGGCISIVNQTGHNISVKNVIA